MLRRFKSILRDFFYGFAVLTPVKSLKKAKFIEDSAMMIVALGDMLGIPFAPPIYKLRILPYFIPMVGLWKEYILKEKDIVEKLE